MSSEMIFPQYRRYLNGKSYFCFFSRESFEEVRALGSKWIVETHRVKILPDRNFVEDMLTDYREMAEKITSGDYDEARAKALK